MCDQNSFKSFKKEKMAPGVLQKLFQDAVSLLGSDLFHCVWVFFVRNVLDNTFTVGHFMLHNSDIVVHAKIDNV